MKVRGWAAAAGLIVWLGWHGAAASGAENQEQELISHVDHVSLLKALDDNAFKRGEAIYRGLCANCHGTDGVTATIPTAVAFSKSPFKYGSDPLSMFNTVTNGNGEMPQQSWMTPEERYAVIHYIREAFMKGKHPAYREIDEAYLKSLPRYVPAPDHQQRRAGERDFGPGLASQLQRHISCAMTVRLGEGMTMAYNLHRMEAAGVWQGGFLDLSQTHHEQLRGEGEPQPAGPLIPGLSTWGWGHDGTLDFDRSALPPRGPMPRQWLDYHGHYLHGDRLILSYAIDGRDVLEMPLKEPGFDGGITHVLHIGPGDAPLLLCAGQLEGEGLIRGVASLDYVTAPIAERGSAAEHLAVAAQVNEQGEMGPYIAAVTRGDVEGMMWQVDERGRLVLHIPPARHARIIEVTRQHHNGLANLENLAGLVQLKRLRGSVVTDLTTLTGGGPLRWPDVLETVGVRGEDNHAYTLDTITLPETNPWNAWLRTGAIDFFDDGRLVVTTYGGDVWIVDGVDETLSNLRWKRYAAGLFEPFGVRVINGVIYVTCRDRIVRLHDRNGDGEADFYESFFADPDVSVFFHAFNFDLQTDAAGNLYYAKAGQYTDYALPGSIMRVAPDGSRYDVIATGFRTPNGMGVMPDGRLTVSDNQGNWIPASKVSVIREGGFYGYVQTHIGGARYGTTWAPDGGRIDHRKVKPPPTFDQPMIWLPQSWDSSSGGQVTADPKRWGPLSNRFLHTTFGKGWMFYLTMQEMDGMTQAAVVRLPHQFNSGIMRARVNPVDGQVYATGLTGWQGPPNAREGGIQRLRYTGRPITVLEKFEAIEGGVRLTFNRPLDRASATDRRNYRTLQWNYRWRHEYGSPHYLLSDPEKQGQEPLPLEAVTLSDDGHTLTLHASTLQPVHQLLVEMNIRTADGEPFRESVLMTIHKLAKAQ